MAALLTLFPFVCREEKTMNAQAGFAEEVFVFPKHTEGEAPCKEPVSLHLSTPPLDLSRPDPSSQTVSSH